MSRLIHLYRPQRTAPEDLENILVAREPLLQEILDRLTKWESGASRQHHLIIGPRGSGKTNLVRLIEHRLRNGAELTKKWRPVTLSEEGYRVTTVADLLIESLRILAEDTKDSELNRSYEQVKFDSDDARVMDLSLDALRNYSKKHGCAVLLILENVNRLFERPRRQKSVLHHLRKILIEEDWLTTICTSPTYLNAVTRPEEPLFEFFQVHVLPELTPDEQFELLQKLAILENNVDFEKNLPNLRSQLRALYHFTGGNPRLTIMLFDLVANQNITDVKTELDRLLDQLTPFYQDRMKDLPDQEAKLIETMALLPEGCTPTELAKESRMQPKIVRALMTRLEKAGYIRREQRRKKRTVYIIPERFFRIWHQMNHSRQARGRIQYLLEFFSNWYATKEERDKIWEELTAKFQHDLQEQEENESGDTDDIAEYMMYIAAVSEGSERYEREFERLQQLISVSNGDFLQQELQKLDREYQSDGEYFLHKGYFLADELGRHEEALEAFQQAVDITPADPFAVFNQAIALDKLGKKSEAQVTYKRTAILLSRNRGSEEAAEVQSLLMEIIQHDSNSHVVRMSAYLIGRMGDSVVVDDLKSVLECSAEPWRRQHCATALGILRAHQALDVLLKCLRDKANNVRGSAATALGRIGSEKAVRQLIQALEDEANNVRGGAATALGRIASEKAVKPLIQVLQDEDWINRASAATALGRIGSEQAVEALIQALQVEANDVRGSAATALGRIASEKAVEPLIQVLQDEDWITRASAATALGRIGSEQAVEALIQALQDEANDVRGSAATALGQIGLERAVEPLIQALKDEANNVRGSAATALGQIASEKAVEPLIQTLKDEAYDVRGSAATALGRIASEKAVEPLIKALEVKANNVRGSALTALGRIASEKPVPGLTRVVASLLQHLNEEPKEQMEAVLTTLLRASFRSGNLNMISDVVQIVVRSNLGDEGFYQPYVIAMNYLQADRDPAILERQHPEMREAVELLVDAFDSGNSG